MSINATLIAIAFIDADGRTAPLSAFTKGEVPCRATWAAAADLAIVLDQEMVVVAAASIKRVNEDGTFVLDRSSEWADAVVGLDLSDVVSTTPWVRRRPTRYVSFDVNTKGAVTTVATATVTDIAARYAA